MSRILGVDCGSNRVGLALSDGLQLTANPLEVVPRSEVIEYVRDVAEQLELGKIVVGLPTGLSGSEGTSAQDARDLAVKLGAATGLPVEFHDEKYTSRMAEAALLEAGVRRRDRRKKIDKVAAAIILQDYLDQQ